MATSNFIVKNGLTVGSTDVINSSGTWTGPASSYQGVQGPTGFQGSAGDQGASGFQGAQGATGFQGAQGAAGTQGPQGSSPIGAQGVQGATGAQGPQGRTGAQGAAGIQGPQGSSPVGAQGASGFQGAQGPTGPTGGTGAQGPRGPQGGAGSTGPQGSPGPTGPQGGTGPTGPQGPQGPSASGGTTSTPNVSALGINAAVGPTGTIQASGNITAGASDKRLKDISGTIENCLEKIQAWSGIYYTQSKLAESFGYNDYSKQVGLIAQQVKTSAPEIVSPAPFDIDANGNSKTGENYLTVQYEKVVPIVIEAIKEQQKQISALLTKLENRGK